MAEDEKKAPKDPVAAQLFDISTCLDKILVELQKTNAREDKKAGVNTAPGQQADPAAPRAPGVM